MADAEQKQEAPGEFLKGLGASLEKAKGADTDLAKILSAHILVAHAGEDAVTKAKVAIVALAEQRAKPPEAGSG